MATKAPNDRLARMMAAAGFDSHKAFARAVMAESRQAGQPLKRCDHTYVARWLDGMTPRGSTATFIAAALSRKLRRTVTVSEIGMNAGNSISPNLGFSYSTEGEAGTQELLRLWNADLNESSVAILGQVDPTAWADASLRWLVSPGAPPPEKAAAGRPRIGLTDVERFRTTVELFVQLDNRFGGGHARHSLIQYLASDGDRMLQGQYTENIGRALYSAVAEATLLAAWMSYDSALHGLAQRYFIQALRLAQTGGDRLLAASILDAMSHQATFVGKFSEAANLARAARTGTQGLATATLNAHFYAMEARALARIGDARACDLALSASVREFERRNPDNDPEWISYFDDAELSAEFGHCFRDLGRAIDASQYANQCLGTIENGVYQRSDFFATMVLADAHLRSGELERACKVALRALRLGDQLRSARCVSYFREFWQRLDTIGTSSETKNFHEQARSSRLWRIASSHA